MLPVLWEYFFSRADGMLFNTVRDIADEPLANNASRVAGIKKQYKKVFAGCKIIEAMLTSNQLSDGLDNRVPQRVFFTKIYSFDEDHIKAAENSFTLASCPRDIFTNLFIEPPLIQTSYLHRINVKYDAAGYLQWDLNVWDGSRDSLLETCRDRDKLRGRLLYFVPRLSQTLQFHQA